jgi:hypothetical protein
MPFRGEAVETFASLLSICGTPMSSPCQRELHGRNSLPKATLVSRKKQNFPYHPSDELFSYAVLRVPK